MWRGARDARARSVTPGSPRSCKARPCTGIGSSSLRPRPLRPYSAAAAPAAAHLPHRRPPPPRRPSSHAPSPSVLFLWAAGRYCAPTHAPLAGSGRDSAATRGVSSGSACGRRRARHTPGCNPRSYMRRSSDRLSERPNSTALQRSHLLRSCGVAVQCWSYRAASSPFHPCVSRHKLFLACSRVGRVAG
eukprot:scaffold46875_cov65-Phaeocystis_antarctica.AAC.2